MLLLVHVSKIHMKVHCYTLNGDSAMTDFYFLNKSLEQSLLSSYFALYTNNSTACDDSAWLQCRSIQFIVRELWPLR